MPITRYNDWPTRLHLYIESIRDTPFKYGSFDCGTLAAGAIEAMTGDDLASELRGYTSAREALAASKRVCGSYSIPKLGEYISAKYGLKEVPILMAQRGDLAIVRNRRFGIVSLTGTNIYVPHKVGVIEGPLTSATKVYRV
jgi:hypothetical protein